MRYEGINFLGIFHCSQLDSTALLAILEMYGYMGNAHKSQSHKNRCRIMQNTMQTNEVP